MIAAFSRALARAAARRFPPGSQVRREWLGELDYLAMQGKRLLMLRYSAGLAFVRPASAPAIGFNWPNARAVLILLMAPTALAIATNWVGRVFALSMRPSNLLVALFVVYVFLLYISAGWWGGTRSVATGPLPVAVLLTLSVWATLWLPTRGYGPVFGGGEWLAGWQVWLPALPMMLLVVGRAAQAGRRVSAMVAGVLGWLVVLDVAVMVDFWAVNPNSVVQGGDLPWHAPLWFVSALTGQTFGLLGEEEAHLVGSTYMPWTLVLCAAFAIGYAVGACSSPRRLPDEAHV